MEETLGQAVIAPRVPFVVGIAGGSASGKSTFAAALVRALGDGEPPLRAEVLGMDRYFYRSAAGGPTFVSPSTGETQPDCNHPDSADNARLLADLEARRAASDAPDVLIVEGLMALHVAEIRDVLDLRLFIELDADERALRRLIRNLKGGREEAERIALYYRECARVGHALYVEPSRVHADLILRGDGDFRRTAALMAAVVRDLRLRELDRTNG
jgi:uridine kinase